jgi:hypothetical protein
MKEFEITISKVVYRTTDEFTSEDEARTWAIAQRNKYRELIDDDKVDYFYDLYELSND